MNQSLNLEKSCKVLFDQLWDHYTALVVDAKKVELKLRERGDVWSEDHVAFRTIPGEFCGAHVLQKLFEFFGYTRRDDYHFDEKQLSAFWMQPPQPNGRHSKEVLPKVFISEIILDRFTPEFKKILTRASAQVSANPLAALKAAKSSDELVEISFKFLSQGPSWARLSSTDYEVLRKESEYGAWTALFGSRINHFTVSVHLMKTFQTLKQLNDFIVDDLRIPMNTSGGGIIKGTPDLRLEQSSTLACEIPYLFQDCVKKIPYAFVEFAYRYPQDNHKSDGVWNSYYQGFVSNNADKIFESTNVR